MIIINKSWRIKDSILFIFWSWRVMYKFQNRTLTISNKNIKPKLLNSKISSATKVQFQKIKYILNSINSVKSTPNSSKKRIFQFFVKSSSTSSLNTRTSWLQDFQIILSEKVNICTWIRLITKDLLRSILLRLWIHRSLETRSLDWCPIVLQISCTFL